MNWAHIHLIFNHLPVIGMPFALAFFVFALWVKHEPTKTFSLVILITVGLLTIPVYLTGEPAEPFLKDVPGILESFIKSHEELAELSLIAVLATAFCAALSLVFRNKPWRSLLLKATLALSILSSSFLGYTAFLGGKIRHTEVRSLLEGKRLD